MTAIPTVRVHNPRNKDQCIIINESDFIPGFHYLWQTPEPIIEGDLVVVIGEVNAEATQELAVGLGSLGILIKQISPLEMPPEKTVLGICNGLRGEKRGAVECFNSLGIPVIVTDLGYVRRREYFQTSLNTIGWVPPFPCPPDRFTQLGVALQPRQAKGEDIVVLGQVPGDAQHAMTDEELLGWAQLTIYKLRKQTKRRIIWRTHPYITPEKASAEEVGADEVSLGVMTPLDADLGRAHAVVTFNSTAGIEALMAGIPVFCSPRAFYSPLCNRLSSDIEKPHFPSDTQRQDFFNRLAYAQWSKGELKSGQAARWLLTNVVVRHYA